jgi:hypothetical protein
MISVSLLLLTLVTPASGGADPDLHRKVPEGHRIYDGDTAEVGAVYEAFLIHFKDDKTIYLSPSRYRVAYAADALQCRNTEEFPMDLSRAGRWWRVVFEVLAVRETAVEDPAGSGKWTWNKQFDCLFKDIQAVE